MATIGIIVVFLIISYFNDMVFNLEAVYFLGLGLLLLASNLRRKSDQATDVIFDLFLIPFQVILIYGAVAMGLLSGLGKFFPESWEWPVAPDSDVIVFNSGKKVALLSDLRRLQVYGSDNRFSNGWIIDASSTLNARMHKNESAAPDADETFLIRLTLHPKATVYNLDGIIAEEKDWGYDSADYPEHKARDFPEIFPVAWYKWPLASELRGLGCMLVGLIGVSVMGLLHRFFQKRKRNEDDIKHEL